MAEESFKERARQEMIKAAKQYKDIYVDYEYLICSVTFEKNDYYIIAAEEDNFQHLTGVQSKIDAKTFFRKCYDGTLAVFIVKYKCRKLQTKNVGRCNYIL